MRSCFSKIFIQMSSGQLFGVSLTLTNSMIRKPNANFARELSVEVPSLVATRRPLA